MSSAAKKLIGTTALEQAAEGPTDPETVLLLTGDGTDGAQNNTFLDSSSNNHTITRNGNVTQGTFTPFSKEEGKWGNYFDGSGDYLSWTGPSTGTNDFTLEAWIYPTADGSGSFGGKGIIAAGDVFLSMGFDDNNKISTRWYTGSGQILTSTSSVSLNEWTHVAVTLERSVAVKIYINGVLDTSTTSNVTPNAATNWVIGREGQQSNYFEGYISNARVNTDIVYTSAFTPSTTPLTAITNTDTLTCQSNRFVDNSSNNHAITATGDPEVTTFSPFANSTGYDPDVVGGSGYFGGDLDYLNSNVLPDFDLGTNDFTIKFWVYSLGKVNDFPRMLQVGPLNNEWNDNQFAILYKHDDDSDSISVSMNGIGGNAQLLASGPIDDFQWIHVAVTRSGTLFTLYINGESIDTFSDSGSATGTGDKSLHVGGVTDSDTTFFGYISNLYVNNGAAESVSLPDSLEDDTTKTTLLNFTNAGIIDSSLSNVIETVGNAQIDTTVVKYGTGAMEFDGTGDYLKVPPSYLFYFATGDFTIECWINTTVRSSNSGERRIFKLHGPESSSADQIQLLIDENSGVIEFYSNTPVLTGTTAVDDGSWHHIALVRNSGTTTLFVDGSSEDSAADTTDYDVSTEPSPNIGSFDGTAGDFNGYIDDLRITKGLARYTTNFTPPGALIEQ